MSYNRGKHPNSAAKQFLAHLNNDGNHQLLSQHLLSVSKLCENHLQKIGAPKAGALLGLLHDFGKYSEAFQQYLGKIEESQDSESEAPKRGSVIHSTAGAQLIFQHLGNQTLATSIIIGEILAICVASHHTGLMDCVKPDGGDSFTRRMQSPDADSHLAASTINCEKEIESLTHQLLSDPELPGQLISIIKNICVIDKQEGIRRFKIGLLTRFLFSALIDADRTDTAESADPHRKRLTSQKSDSWPVLAQRLETHLSSMDTNGIVNQLRRQVSNACLEAAASPKGVFTLTVPTGGGKTLASLRFALNHVCQFRMDRVVYVSPYTSIIDQNAQAVRKILEPAGTKLGSVVLEHHSNLAPVHETQRSKLLTENWDAPVVFTTAVQFLEALFGEGTRAVRRMHQLANAVIIFDEVQTLPVRCIHLFNNAMNFLSEQCGATVVLCTATQPGLDQVNITKGAFTKGREIIPDVADLFSKLKRVEAFDHRKTAWSHQQVAQFAKAETTLTGSCLIVVNTKREALEIYHNCAALENIEAFHLSTNMCPAHRMQVLNEVKAKLRANAPVICVSTQLIEAGVDISFGSAIRALAGADSIAQTAGRCNRHGERTLGRVHIVKLEGEIPAKLKDIRIAAESAQRVLDEAATPGNPFQLDLSDTRFTDQYFRYYFNDRRKEMDYPVTPDKAERQDTLLNMLSLNSPAAGALKSPRYMTQSFMTAAKAFQAIDANTRGVIVPYGDEGKRIIADLCGAFEPTKQFQLLKQANQYSVNVFDHVLNTLQKKGAISEAQPGTGILCLLPNYYRQEAGLNLDGNEEMEGYIA